MNKLVDFFTQKSNANKAYLNLPAKNLQTYLPIQIQERWCYMFLWYLWFHDKKWWTQKKSFPMRVRQGLLQGHKIDLCSTAADFNQSYLLTLVNACRFVTLLCPTNAGRAVWHDKLMKNASLSEQLLKVTVVQQNFFCFLASPFIF